MQAVTTVGLDIAKSVFQVPGIDAEGKVLIRRNSAPRFYSLSHLSSSYISIRRVSAPTFRS